MASVVEFVDADYLVVGAGAAGMAFVDALIANADVRVAVVDRRHTVGGHWLDAYPFVRLHQASRFYGVASTPLGNGAVQTDGPEKGLHERASAPEICDYYARVMRTMTSSGHVSFHPLCEYRGDHGFVSRLTGQRYRVPGHCRVVDARYLSPHIPATTPPPFDVADDARVIPVNELVEVADAPSEFVVVGSGKTATDACIWLLGNGVDPDDLRWVRPREPWMLNRAVIQPDPAVFIGMVADMLELAASAASLDGLFEGLEAAGIMLRIDQAATPTMAKTPTLATWELDLLRTIENVVRLGHVRAVESTRITLDRGEVAIATDAVVLHCAAPGLRYPGLVPVWGREAITLQTIRSGFPCFGAALTGYVEATRDDDVEKNRLCPPAPYSNTPADWAAMQVLGNRASMSFSAESDIRTWARGTTLNPSRVPVDREQDPEVIAASTRVREQIGPGMTRLAELAGIDSL